MAFKSSEEVIEMQKLFLRAHADEIEELITRERPHFAEHPHDQVRGSEGFEQHQKEAAEKWEAKGDAMSEMIAKTQKQIEAYGDSVMGYWVQGVTWGGKVMSSPELQTKGKAREEQPEDIASEKPLNDSG
ncbi:MAG: hypothetical protein Q9198_004676, partial [Flavoplaca austrocitrina]